MRCISFGFYSFKDNNHPALSILDPSKCTKCPVRTSCPKCKCPTVSCDTCRAEMFSECPGGSI